MEDGTLFEETQRLPLWARIGTYFFLAVFAIPAVVFAILGVVGEMWILLAFAVVFLAAPIIITIVVHKVRVTTQVSETGVTVAYGRKTDELALDEIVRVEAIRADDTPIPHRLAGRFDSGGDVAVFMGKTDAVGMEDRDGNKLIVGTQRPHELVSVIEQLI